MICIVCKKHLSGRQKKYCSIKCKNKNHQSYESQKKRGLKRKIQLVKKFGGCCYICKYNKNLAALEFHHPNKNKEFKLDIRSLSNRTWNKIIKEAEKCQLVCSNCHAEIHNPHLTNWINKT